VTTQISLPSLQNFQQFAPTPSACAVTRAIAPPTPPPNV
jgi:hypothetical protein